MLKMTHQGFYFNFNILNTNTQFSIFRVCVIAHLGNFRGICLVHGGLRAFWIRSSSLIEMEFLRFKKHLFHFLGRDSWKFQQNSRTSPTKKYKTIQEQNYFLKNVWEELVKKSNLTWVDPNGHQKEWKTC